MRNAMQRVRCRCTLACFLHLFKLKKKEKESMRAGTTRDAVATEQVYIINKKETHREKRERREAVKINLLSELDSTKT